LTYNTLYLDVNLNGINKDIKHMNKLLLQITLHSSLIPHTRLQLSDSTIIENNSVDSITTKSRMQDDSILRISFMLKTTMTNRQILSKARKLQSIRSYNVSKYNCIHFVEELLDIKITKNILLLLGGGIGIFSAYKLLRNQRA